MQYFQKLDNQNAIKEDDDSDEDDSDDSDVDVDVEVDDTQEDTIN